MNPARLRPGLTIRRLMIAVAMVAVGLILGRRGVEFERTWKEHDVGEEIRLSDSPEWGTTRLQAYWEPPWRGREYRRMMVRKYWYAASHPWPPVAADPTSGGFDPGPAPRPYPWEPLPTRAGDR